MTSIQKYNDVWKGHEKMAWRLLSKAVNEKVTFKKREMTMRNLFKLRNMFLVLSLALASYGCGKSDSNNSSGGGTVAVTPGVCPAGQVWITQANACIAQSGCPLNQGFYNNTCTAGVNSQYPYYGTGGTYAGGQYPGYGYGNNYGYNGGVGGGAYYGSGGGFPYNQGGYNTQYYSPYQSNCYYKQKGIFYYYVCN